MSHNFDEVQVDYIMIAKDFLMVAFGFKKFRLYLIGPCMVIFTMFLRKMMPNLDSFERL